MFTKLNTNELTLMSFTYIHTSQQEFVFPLQLGLSFPKREGGSNLLESLSKANRTAANL